ncbi:hypothetical protein HLV39_12205 [Marinobacter adhaerens]|uniref:Uncharacterized protein n=1 Tax=Marinobacter adhaerens TaxID=1033846 RepID=A0A851HZB9_9GAMM|nr:hypothetical protein [Marinobacter adhaerens]NWN92255.1 hypothetical protein [Marinobacter adhaerens]
MKASVITALLMIACAIVLASGVSYGLATMGEPQSVWLWCDLVGQCPGGEK